MLTILTVTKAGREAEPFIKDMSGLAAALGAIFVVGLDGDVMAPPPLLIRKNADIVVPVESKGYIESVLEQVLESAPEGWILRLDDDERVSIGLFNWLVRGSYRSSDHWKFPRAHLWGSDQQFIAAPPLWPDWQTRLSIKAKSGGRNTVHAGSPFGGGDECPHPIEHHKFLVKDVDERTRIADVYDRFSAGYGTSPGMLPFSLPELAFGDPSKHLRNLGEVAA